MNSQIVDDPLHPLSPASKALAKNIVTALRTAYPAVGPGWEVTVKEGQGIVQVINRFLSGKMGFILHVMKIDSEMKNVKRAGGELLERYNVLRHPQLSIDAALKHTKFNNKGAMIHEI